MSSLFSSRRVSAHCNIEKIPQIVSLEPKHHGQSIRRQEMGCKSTARIFGELMPESRGALSNWSKCKRVAATLFILLFTPVLAGSQSTGASVKTWIEIKAADEAAKALANPKVTAEQRLRVEQIYYRLVRTIRSLSQRKTHLPHFSGKTGRRKQPLNIGA